ncbi:MAG: hypothetical protein F6J98_09025 [Moorea sp. SIO4G2]|uniref:hypothetical protein n=1 Tax=Moorena sp. SIO4A5 TaxID=2607838 RepID=UPI0013C9A8D9|nr:hypothetical protein [Moorena sp. SIO4A5]NEO24454.1 hypothetical protein [Moorena sp. SIO4A5]NEO60563.1 hypothetical protein [Moorena sp. SIO4G2]
MTVHTYSVFHNYQVHRIFYLLPVPCSLFPVACSLFPKSQEFVPHPIVNRCNS